jgi:two-component system, OmpR family, response regulator
MHVHGFNERAAKGAGMQTTTTTSLVTAKRRRPRAASERPRILVVDDDVKLRTRIAERMRVDGVEVVEAGDGAEAFEAVGYDLMAQPTRYFDLVISDLRMPKGGLELLWALRFTDYQVPVLLLSGVVKDHQLNRISRVEIQH